jgi:hypothetical protein
LMREFNANFYLFAPKVIFQLFSDRTYQGWFKA